MRILPAMAPLCAIAQTPGPDGLAGCIGSNVSGTWSTKLTAPRQFGPSKAMPASRAIAAISFWIRSPSPPSSPKPEAKTTAPPTPRRAQAAIASLTAGTGITRTTASIPCGKSSMVATQGRPLISLRVRLTRCRSPAKPKRSTLSRTLPPSENGSGDAPTIASERGRSSRSKPLRAGAPVAAL